jgi:hypothetical protein
MSPKSFEALFVTSLLLLCSCMTTIPRINAVGQIFPSVSGNALDGKVWSFPSDLKGQKVLLLIGFKQETQFDIDRWLIGIDQKKYKINVFEVPTIKGWFPSLISGKIDSGMRSGIPEELWKIVVTVYQDADKIVGFMGNEDPLNARVVVLNEDGKVLFLHDRGFSVSALNNLSPYFPVESDPK